MHRGVQCFIMNSQKNLPKPFFFFLPRQTCYMGLYVCSSFLKKCLIQLCDASLACFFGMAPFCTNLWKRSKMAHYLLRTEVFTRSTDSQSVGVVNVQLIAFLKNCQKDLSIMSPVLIDHSFLLCQGSEGGKGKLNTKERKHVHWTERKHFISFIYIL